MALFPFFNRSTIEQSQAQKEVTANAMMSALARSAGFLSKAIVAGTNNLSEEESEYGFIDLTGALGAGATVTQDADVTKRTFYRNSTTGGQTVQVRIGTGTLFTVPVDEILLLLSTTVGILIPRVVVPITLNMDLITLTNLPAALTELNAQTHRRTKYNLTNFTQARVCTRVETAGFAGSELRVQYSTDESSWNYLDNTAGPASNLDATGVQTDGFITLNAAAKADVFLRPVTINGDGTADPVIGEVVLQVR